MGDLWRSWAILGDLAPQSRPVVVLYFIYKIVKYQPGNLESGMARMANIVLAFQIDFPYDLKNGRLGIVKQKSWKG